MTHWAKTRHSLMVSSKMPQAWVISESGLRGLPHLIPLKKNLIARTSNWVPAFAGTTIHGVFLLASDSDENLIMELAHLERILGSAVLKLHILKGNVRPGDQLGHERAYCLRTNNFLSLCAVDMQILGSW